MIRFLERHGAPVSYTTLRGRAGRSRPAAARPTGARLRPLRVLVRAGGPTRSPPPATAASACMFLSSDTMAWRIRFADPQTIVAYKEHAALDPDRAGPTGAFGSGGGGAHRQPLPRLHPRPGAPARTSDVRARPVASGGDPATPVAVRRHRTDGHLDDPRHRRLRARRARPGHSLRDDDGRRWRGTVHGCRAGEPARPPGPGRVELDHLHRPLRRVRVRQRNARLGAGTGAGAERVAAGAAERRSPHWCA